MQQACAARTESGARCRHLAAEGSIFCSHHKCLQLMDIRMAPRPNKILVKFRVNDRWTRRFRALGIKEADRRFESDDARHASEAESIRRKADRYREVPDSGVPVFGKEGALDVTLSGIWRELLQAEGYGIAEVHLEPAREARYMTTLVITLIHGETPSADVPAGIVEGVESFFDTASFGFVHVWANPPKPDATVVHTVNASHRKDEKPKQTLRFNNGLWALGPVTS